MNKRIFIRRDLNFQSKSKKFEEITIEDISGIKLKDQFEADVVVFKEAGKEKILQGGYNGR